MTKPVKPMSHLKRLLARHRAYSRLAVKFAGQPSERTYELIARQALNEYHALKERREQREAQNG